MALSISNCPAKTKRENAGALETDRGKYWQLAGALMVYIAKYSRRLPSIAGTVYIAIYD
jgi:hypothetical protein